MANSVQTNNGNVQEWHNQSFADMYEAISARLPSMTFWAIIFSYAATAALNVWAIHLPLFISVPLAISIQGLRFLTVFTPFLNPHGRAGHLPEVIAVGASMLAMFELSFSIQALGMTMNEFWSIFLFGAAIIVLSMILEIQFINQGKKAFGLTGTNQGKQASGGAVSTTNAQSQNLGSYNAISTEEIEALRAEIQKTRLAWMILNDDAEDIIKDREFAKSSKSGNGQAPTRPKPSTANMGHSANGMNGHSLNHQKD